MPPQPPFDSSTPPPAPVQPSYNSASTKYTPLAWVSFSFGIAGIVLFFVGPLLGLIAIITGHIARSQIRRQPFNLKGAGVAMTGLITGYLSVILGSLLIAAAVFIPVALQEAKLEIQSSVQHDVKATAEQVKATGDYSKYSVIQTSGDTEVVIYPDATTGQFVVMGHSPSLDSDGYVYAYVSAQDKYYVSSDDKMCEDIPSGECFAPEELLQPEAAAPLTT